MQGFPVPLMYLLNLLVGSVGVGILIPSPNGTYGIALSTMKLTDLSRLDPFSPKVEHRSVMVSIFQPVSPHHCTLQPIKYMPPATSAFEDLAYASYGLPNGTFELINLSICATPQIREEFPLVLFSPGLGKSRLLYNIIAQAVASHGYIVATIDHPYDADIVEYPDNTLVYGADISTDEEIILSVETRARDISFVRDQLASNKALSISKGRVTAFGHSLGGAAIATAMMNDTAIAGGVNLDGTFYGPVVTQGIRTPLLLFGHEGKNQSTDPTWAAIWPHLGPKLELMLNGSQHGTFTDFPTLLEILDFSPPGVLDLIGSLSGTRGLAIITEYLVAFFEFVLSCKLPGLLKGPSDAFPEVEFVDNDDLAFEFYIRNGE